MITRFWSLLNIASKQIQWVLDKAMPDITLSKQSIILDSDNLIDTFTITTSSDGNLSVVSNDDSIATVSLSSNTVTVEGLTNGTATITVNVTESGNYLSGSTSLLVNVSLASTTLNSNSWATISQISQAGTASNYWSVGDTKEVVLNGNTTNAYNNIRSFTNYSCYAAILGFDHNASLESNGEHSIHFILDKTSTGNDFSFYRYRMNDSDTTSGGWNGSNIKRTTMLEFKNILPSDLQAVLKNITKYTHNTMGGTQNASAANVTATTEQVFLLSEFEVFGSAGRFANQYEKNKQAQYAYYTNGNSKKKCSDIDGSAYSWWLRSACCYNDYTGYFCYVDTNGGPYFITATNAPGVSPAFVV